MPGKIHRYKNVNLVFACMLYGVAPIKQARTYARDKKYHSEEVTLCGKSDFPYHKELLLKKRIRFLWEQILSF